MVIISYVQSRMTTALAGPRRSGRWSRDCCGRSEDIREIRSFAKWPLLWRGMHRVSDKDNAAVERSGPECPHGGGRVRRLGAGTVADGKFEEAERSQGGARRWRQCHHRYLRQMTGHNRTTHRDPRSDAVSATLRSQRLGKKRAANRQPSFATLQDSFVKGGTS